MTNKSLKHSPCGRPKVSRTIIIVDDDEFKYHKLAKTIISQIHVYISNQQNWNE